MTSEQREFLAEYHIDILEERRQKMKLIWVIRKNEKNKKSVG